MRGFGVNSLQHGAGSGLLSGAARTTNAALYQGQLRNFASHIKCLLVRRAQSVDHFVVGQGHFARLQPFLQFGLGVFANGGHAGVDIDFVKQALHQGLRCGVTGRSEKFLASETVREKLFRLTGDELPYTSTVVIDKFEEEAGRGKQKRLLRIAATIVVERDGHKAMVIGDKGERIKRIGTETRVELEKLLDAKVFIEMWVKVRSGWADDEARVRSFGYE